MEALAAGEGETVVVGAALGGGGCKATGGAEVESGAALAVMALMAGRVDETVLEDAVLGGGVAKVTAGRDVEGGAVLAVGALAAGIADEAVVVDAALGGGVCRATGGADVEGGAVLAVEALAADEGEAELVAVLDGRAGRMPAREVVTVVRGGAGVGGVGVVGVVVVVVRETGSGGRRRSLVGSTLWAVVRRARALTAGSCCGAASLELAASHVSFPGA